jgi:hypothetical protein
VDIGSAAAAAVAAWPVALGWFCILNALAAAAAAASTAATTHTLACSADLKGQQLQLQSYAAGNDQYPAAYNNIYGKTCGGSVA